MFKLVYLFFLEGLIFYLINQHFSFQCFDLISLIIIAINSTFFIFFIGKECKSKKEYLILLFAYFLRLFLLYFDIYGREIFQLPNSGNDSEMFHLNAMLFSSGEPIIRGGMYSTFVGIIYILFGPQRLIAQYFNILIGMYSIIFIKRSMDLMGVSRKIELILLSVVSFMPTLSILSAILKRESIITFFITMSLFYFLKWFKSGNINSFIISTSLPVIAASFHSGAIAVTVAYIICYILYSQQDKTYKLTVKSFSLAIMFLVLFYILNILLGDLIFAKFSDIEDIVDVVGTAERRARGGSAYLTNMNPTGLVSIIIYTPIRVFYFLFSPLPWNWRGLSDIFSFFTNSSIYIFSFYSLRKSRKMKNQNNVILVALLIITILTATMFAWGVSNTGTALRHRSKYIAFYILMIALSLDKIKEYKMK